MIKKNIFKLLFISITLLSFNACTFNDSVDIESYYFDVYAKDWKWNSVYNRYECLFDFPELSLRTYEGGSIQGSVFVKEIDASGYNFEGQKNLPFSQTYLSRDKYYYTETISFDTSRGSISTVCFYIQTTDFISAYNRNYTFKITLIGE